jgi:ketosteroid isomerase-like protein
LEDQWTVALQTSDVEKILGFHAPEAVNLRSNQPILVGLDAIRNRTVSMFADTTLLFNTYKSTIDIIEVSASGDLAYARGHDEIATKTKDGLVKDNGKWVDIWKKIDGQWKVTVSVGNSDLPLAGQ